jgi:hypothetical protein
MKPNTKPTATVTQAELLDPRRDLILVAGPERISFQVRSRALARASRVWEVMLYGPFFEGKDQQNDESWIVALPGDNPDALRILLGAVHCQFDNLPAKVDRNVLINVALLCDKYDMVGLLKSFWHGWVTGLDAPTRDPSGFAHRLVIAHTLGYLHYYKTTLKEFLAQCQTLEGKTGIFLESNKEENMCENAHLQALGVGGE